MAGIPTATVGRLVTYLRVLAELVGERVEKTSSDELARRAQVSAFQVRKDLAYCGRLGTRGSGYQVAVLVRELRRVLGLTRPWHVAIVGMGRLGQALADYPHFDQYDFSLCGAFDADERKVGLRVGPLTVAHVDDLPPAVRRDAIDMAFLTVPAAAAQAAADLLVAAGIRGILNFAPTVIDVPEEVRVESVDFLAGLTRLTFRVGTVAGEALGGAETAARYPAST
jgi:redox-sensing transcriptional repressor